MAFTSQILKRFKKKRYWVTSLVILAVVVFGAYRASAPQEIEFSSTTVERTNLVQSVEETGSVRAETDLAYGWEISGRVASITHDVGAHVSSSDIIAELDNAIQQSRLLEAQSQLAAAQAALNLQLVGVSAEQRAASEATVANAKASLAQTKAAAAATDVAGENAIAAAESAFWEVDTKIETDLQTDEESIVQAYQDGVQDAKDGLTDGLDVLITIADLQDTYDELSDGFPHSITLAVKKSAAVLAMLGATTNGKLDAEKLLTYTGGSRGEVNGLSLSSTRDEIDAALDNLRNALDKVKSTSDITLTALNAESQATAADFTALDSARSTIDTAIATVIAAEQTIANAILAKSTNQTTNELSRATAQQNWDNAKSNAAQNNASAAADIAVAEAALAQAEASHAELIAPPRGVDVAALRADVTRQVANVTVLERELEKTRLRALSDGVVAMLDVEVGETVTANQEILGIVSDDLDIDVDISETDIAKVAVGDEVHVTLDAFGEDEVFMGTVDKIEPAETEISGVIYYKTTVHLSLKKDNGEGVRPGMTANVQIITDTMENVLVIPRRAIQNRDGQKFVRVVKDAAGVFEEVEITTGLSGDDGLIAVMSGLSEGDEIVTFLKE